MFPARLSHSLFLVLLLPVLPGAAADGLRIAWTNNMLTLSSPELPGQSVPVWYLEAFCRGGSTHRDWQQTTIPHQTELVSADGPGRRIRLRTQIKPSVEVTHDLRAGSDEVDFRLEAKNTGPEFVDVQWFQPCMRVAGFTGLAQSNYHTRSFIFTSSGLVTMDKTRRAEDALYRGGQVYVPAGINTNDVNPRPLSPDVPVNDLIGCFSADGTKLLAMAWDHTQELFQGVIVCLHNDPRIGGLQPGERKTLRGKIYFMKNDPEALLARYRKDFGKR
jgi:hypothetical protein